MIRPVDCVDSGSDGDSLLDAEISLGTGNLLALPDGSIPGNSVFLHLSVCLVLSLSRFVSFSFSLSVSLCSGVQSKETMRMKDAYEHRKNYHSNSRHEI